MGLAMSVWCHPEVFILEYAPMLPDQSLDKICPCASWSIRDVNIAEIYDIR